MFTITQKDWIKDFGLECRKPPHFFSTIDQIENPALDVPQSQTLRSAFEQLKVEGVLCLERNPTIYFRQMSNVDTDKVIELHREFWNQGIAPILVIITQEEVHVYSGLVSPHKQHENGTINPGLVEILPRVEDKLRSFILSVESGKYFHTNHRSFNPEMRVDRRLLKNLRATREKVALIPIYQ